MIIIGSDHGGFKLKEGIKRYLEETGIKCKDCGCNSEESVDYPDIAKEVALEVKKSNENVGILICRTGNGMAISANKFKGIRCANCESEDKAKYARMHNNANTLALGSDYISENDAICIIRMFLATEFEGGRHQDRIDIIEEIENENMK